IDFPDGLIGIYGRNGAGKSKIVEAIGYALFGPRGMLPEGDTDRDVRSVTAKPRTPTMVTLEFLLRGQHYRVVRGPKTAVYLDGATREQVEGRAEVTLYMQRQLRMTPATYLGDVRRP